MTIATESVNERETVNEKPAEDRPSAKENQNVKENGNGIVVTREVTLRIVPDTE